MKYKYKEETKLDRPSDDLIMIVTSSNIQVMFKQY